MPRSKRARAVHLSKTTKKGKELTLKLHAAIQECIPKFPYIYIFRVENMRNTYLKDVRNKLSDSRIFFGKTKVMAVALGLSKETEPYPNTSMLSPYLHGNVGLLFTPRPSPAIIHYFETFQPMDYARSGTAASRTFVIPAGTIYSRAGEIPQGEDVPLAHSIEPNLRKLGVPSKLVKGRIELENDFTVCRQGEILTSGQTSLLKIFGVATAIFLVDIQACYDRESGVVYAVNESHLGSSDRHEDNDVELEGFDGFEA